MKRLGYTRYVAQGGDGAPLVTGDGAPGAVGLLGIHPNLRRLRATLLRRSPINCRRNPSRNARRINDARDVQDEWLRLLPGACPPGRRRSATALTGFTRRARGLACSTMTRTATTRSRAFVDGKDPRQSPTRESIARQHHAVLADGHRRLGGEVYWEFRDSFWPAPVRQQGPPRSRFPSPSRCFPDEVCAAPRSWVGRSTPAWPTSTRPTAADTSPHGKNRNFFAPELRAAFRSLRAGAVMTSTFFVVAAATATAQRSRRECGRSAASCQRNLIMAAGAFWARSGDDARRRAIRPACGDIRRRMKREPRQIAALRRATEWLNSPPLSATTLLGKVVLVQFGTYTCINWLRTLPYVRAWDAEVQARVGRDRRAHTRVRIRKEPRERASRCAADEDRLSDRRRQRLCDLARLQQPILARAVLHRCAWTPARASLRRGRVRAIGNSRSGGCWRKRAPRATTKASCRSLRAASNCRLIGGT